MTFGKLIKILNSTKLFGCNREQLGLNLLNSTGITYKGEAVTMESVKKWIDGGSPKNISAYLTNEEVKEQELLKYFKRWTLSEWIKLKDTFNNIDGCIVDCNTTDEDVFYRSLINQFLNSLGLPLIEEQNTDTKKNSINHHAMNDVKTKLQKAMGEKVDKFIKKYEISDTLSSENPALNLLEQGKSHIYLYGEGGIGKTFSLMAFVRNMSSSKNNYVVPVFIELSDYKSYTKNGSIIDGLFIIKYAAKLINSTECTYDTIENNSINSILTEFKKPAPNNNPEYILLLDGLNEVASELKYELVEEIDKFLTQDSEYGNTRIVLTGRNKNNYNGNFNSSLQQLKLQPLKEIIIKKYLKERGYERDVIDNITTNQRLLECIKIPFYLNKFMEIGVSGDTVTSASKSAILRAYYAKEPNKFRRDKNVEFMLNSTVPEIANHMEKNDIHGINKEDVCIFLNSDTEKAKIELDILENQLCIINREFNSPEYYKFDHDNTRDYFAAVYTVNMMKIVLQCYQSNTSNESIFEYIKKLNGDLHSSWGKERIYFINEYLETENLNIDSIMDIYRANEEKFVFKDDNYEHIKIRELGIRNIINCVKLSGYTKNQNFSHLDFNNINLTGYDWENSNFAYSKISQNTFIPQGHLNTAKNIAVADNTGECFTISKDDFILRYNINSHDTERIFIKNFDKTGKHIICSKDGGLCFVSDNEDNVWAVHIRDNNYPETKIVNSEKVLRQYNCNYRLIDILLSDDGLNLYVLYNNGENDNSKSLILHMQKNENNKNYKSVPYLFEIKINCFCLFENKLYFGAENGKLYKYFNGSLSEKISFDNPVNCICPSGEYIFIGQKNIDIIKYNVRTNQYILYDYDRSEEAKLENLVLKKVFCSKDGENFGAYFDEKKYFITYDKESDRMKMNTDTAIDIKISCMGYYHNPKNNKSRYIICHRDHNIYIKTSNNYPVNILEGRSGFLCEAYYLAKTDSLICAFWDRSIKKFDAKEGRFVKNIIKSHGNFVDALAYMPENDFFMTGSCDKTIKLWDKDFNEIPNAFADTHTGDVNSIVCSDDGKTVYSAGLSKDLGFDGNNIAVGKGEFFVWRKNDDNTYSCNKIESEIITGKNIGIINSLACDKDGEICYAGSADFNVYKYSRKENLLSSLYKDDGYIDELACSSDGSICYSVSFLPQEDKDGNKGYLIKWDSKSGKKIIFRYKSESDGIKYVTCNSEGDICYIGTGDGKIYVCIWDKYTNEYIICEDEAVMTGYAISKLKCSDDGKKLFIGCDNKILKYELNPNNNLKYSEEWDVIENINIIGCDFSESIIEDEELKNTIKINGGRFI